MPLRFSFGYIVLSKVRQNCSPQAKSSQPIVFWFGFAVSCIAKWIFNHWITSEVHPIAFVSSFIGTAAAAKSLQSCPTLGDPIDGSPPGSPILGILQARTLEWVAISFSIYWYRATQFICVLSMTAELSSCDETISLKSLKHLLIH